MLTPAALPYIADAKFEAPVLTSSEAPTELTAYPSFLASFLIPIAVTTTSSNHSTVLAVLLQSEIYTLLNMLQGRSMRELDEET